MKLNGKKLTGIILAAALVANTGLFTMNAFAEDEKVTIGVTLMDSITEFGIGLKDNMLAYAEGMDDVEITVIDAGGDAEKQVSQVEQFFKASMKK